MEMEAVKESLLARFRKDSKLLAKHGVSQEELAFLEQVAMFGKLESVTDVLFILRNIRQSNA
jgi:hypothetical protein